MIGWKNRIQLLLLTVLAGVLMGLVSAVFMKSLTFVTNLREHQPLLFLLMPAVGVGTVFLYTRYGKLSQRGNNLIIDSVHENQRVPVRMGLFIFICTLATHLTGGSAGKEATAVQIGGTIANGLGQKFHLHRPYHRILVMAGIAAGFGSIFGAPLAGAVFGMEMCFVGYLGYEALLPCFVASFAAYSVATMFGVVQEAHTIRAVPSFTWYPVLVVLLASILFGITGRLFAVAIRALKLFYARLISRPIPRVLLSSAVVLVVMFFLNGFRYAGLSNWMVSAAFAGNVHWYDAPVKLLMTVLTLGAGFQGGEVTPMFDFGSSLGAWIGQMTHVEPSLLAALGMVAVFGCAANTPLTTLVLGFELFGNGALPYLVIAVFVSYYISGTTGIYGAQRIYSGRPFYHSAHRGETLESAAARSMTGHFLEMLSRRKKP